MSGRRRPEDPPTRAEREMAGWLMGGPAPESKERTRPVQHEAAEQAALSDWARTQWWRDGYAHHEQARRSRKEALRLWRQGVRPGWPDVTVHIPYSGKPWSFVAYAIELKSPTVPHKGATGEWWLEWRPKLDGLEHDPTHYGLRWTQAWRLQYLHDCGYRTLVAFGWDEAREWLAKELGERR